ncbi:MAG: hypothetical protein MUQ27_15050 [Acidimicrobiia bacterium]|nr:hypothetical protein [Acidimicrobiia bacterium]
MAGLFTSDSMRVVRLGAIGIVIAAAFYLVGSSVSGLTGFGFTVASIGVGAVTLGLVAAQTVECVTDHRRRASLVATRSQDEAESIGGPVGRCGLCHRQRVRLSGILLCPECDQSSTA